MIYEVHSNRDVVLKEVEEGHFIKTLTEHHADCVDAVYMLLEELKTLDPDIDELVGRLNDDFDVFGVSIPGRETCLLVVSIIYDPHSMVLVHAVNTAPRQSDAIRRIAIESLGLVNPVWEPIPHE